MFSRITGTPNVIMFYFAEQQMFDNISLRTLYRAKNIKSQNGESLIDDYAMTEDEKDAFSIFFERAIYDAFDVVTKMLSGLPDGAVIINSTVTLGDSTTVDNAYGLNVVDNAAFNVNQLYSVDDGIRKFTEASILSQWYDVSGNNDEFVKWETKAKEYRSDLITKRLFQLRKPLIS